MSDEKQFTKTDSFLVSIFLLFLIGYFILLLTGVIGPPYMSVDTFEIEMTYTEWRTNEYCDCGARVVFANTPVAFKLGNLSGDYYFIQEPSKWEMTPFNFDVYIFINTSERILILEVVGKDLTLYKVKYSDNEAIYYPVIEITFIPGYS